jgi:hypothetical protein
LLIIVGVIGVALGVLYLSVEAHSLPTWFPGYVHKVSSNNIHSRRGTAGVIAGGICLVGGLLLAVSARRHSHHRRHRSRH